MRTYEDLIAYLLAKDSLIRVGYLPFEGMNQVLYKLYNNDNDSDKDNDNDKK